MAGVRAALLLEERQRLEAAREREREEEERARRSLEAAKAAAAKVGTGSRGRSGSAAVPEGPVGSARVLRRGRTVIQMRGEAGDGESQEDEVPEESNGGTGRGGGAGSDVEMVGEQESPRSTGSSVLRGKKRARDDDEEDDDEEEDDPAVSVSYLTLHDN
jgi:hypothetical protein